MCLCIYLVLKCTTGDTECIKNLAKQVHLSLPPGQMEASGKHLFKWPMQGGGEWQAKIKGAGGGLYRPFPPYQIPKSLGAKQWGTDRLIWPHFWQRWEKGDSGWPCLNDLIVNPFVAERPICSQCVSLDELNYCLHHREWSDWYIISWKLANSCLIQRWLKPLMMYMSNK